MRSTIASALTALTLSVTVAGAQRIPEPEIGFRAGFTRLSMDDFAGGTETVNVLALPMSVFPGPGGVHFMFFLNERFSLEPNVGLIRTSDADGSFSLMLLSLQPNYFFTPGAERSGYVFAQLGLLRETDSFGGSSDTESQNLLAGGLGYRRVVRKVVATRYEIRFRRFAAGSGRSEMNEIALLFGLGVVIPRSDSR